MKGRALVVEDDAALRRSLQIGLQDVAFEVEAAASGAEALRRVGESEFDVLLTDLNMPEMTGLELCKRVVEMRPDIPVVVITAFGNLDAAVAAMRVGAYDFITKPVEIDALAMTLARAVQHRRLRAEVKRLEQVVASSGSLPELIGESPPIAAVRQLIARVAPTDSTVLITGESGTGKEVAARALHRLSRRSQGPFVAVNCAAVPEALIESELFGHERGAFTDARSARIGLLARAEGGTLFLDEIGELPPSAQAKLLRALQERTVRPVGGARELPFDARIVAATNRDLERAVEEGGFREDLYFRIHVLPLELPPLRARGPDVLLLAQHFLLAYARRSDKAVTSIGKAAAELLLDYQWPGNVRELMNCVEHAVALARYEQITPEDLPARVRSYERSHIIVAGENPHEMVKLEEVERRYILRVLEAAGGNKRMAARILGLDRKTLYRKLERYGVS